VRVKDDIAETVRNIQRHILEGGPCYIGVHTTTDWESYALRGEVWTGQPNGAYGHAMIVVGWGTDGESNTDYWIVRNSYGPFWGEAGYIRMQRGIDFQAVESDQVLCAMMTPNWDDWSAPICRVVTKELNGMQLLLRIACWEDAEVYVSLTGATSAWTGYDCLRQTHQVSAASTQGTLFTFDLASLDGGQHCPQPTAGAPYVMATMIASDPQRNEATRWNLFRAYQSSNQR
jgi:hypothetical protein